MNSHGYGSYGGCLPSVAAVAVWNVYCATSSECCAVAEQPSGDYVVPVLKTPVDWNTAWNWMNTHGYDNYGGCKASSSKVAVWNVYCDGTGKDCVVARKPTSTHSIPALKDPVDWDTAWDCMENKGLAPKQGGSQVTVDVDAKENCIKAGGASGAASVIDGTPLNNGINLKKAQRLTITQIDPAAKWSAGPEENHLGNADGLSLFGEYAVKGQSFP